MSVGEQTERALTSAMILFGLSIGAAAAIMDTITTDNNVASNLDLTRTSGQTSEPAVSVAAVILRSHNSIAAIVLSPKAVGTSEATDGATALYLSNSSITQRRSGPH